MYFDFEDYRPEFSPVGRAMSWREGILLSIIVHLAMVVLLMLAPRFLPDTSREVQVNSVATAERRDREQTRFVFVQPRLDIVAPTPLDRSEASDKDRRALAPERALGPTNRLPFARGNTPERVEEPPVQAARGEGPSPEPPAGEQSQSTNAPPEPAAPPLADSPAALRLPTPPPHAAPSSASGRPAVQGGLLADALRTLQRAMQSESFDNQRGGSGQFGPNIQFDTKGVEFGPWIRRFVAQVKRNWLIPYAAMSMHGHVVITFYVHKDGSITDLRVADPCPIEAFNTAAFGALSASNPTQPLPPDYPAEKAFFTVSFFYNESPG